MEIFTPETDSLKEAKTEANPNNEDLNAEEQTFYQTLKPALNELIEEPKEETINKIMNYSKSVE